MFAPPAPITTTSSTSQSTVSEVSRISPRGPARQLANFVNTIGSDGTVHQHGQPVARLGVFDVADPSGLVKQGATLLRKFDQALTAQANPTLHSESVERANVDPAVELAALMDTQRQLEANANMIRYQDQTLSKLVNEVGKIG